MFDQMLNALTKDEISSSHTLSLFAKNPKTLLDTLVFLEKNLVEKNALLDLGCGYGFVARFIADVLAFKESYGIDIDRVKLERAGKRLQVTRSDLEKNQLPYPNETFDLIISFGVLDHMKFFDNAFAEAYRVLKQDGLFLISLTNLGSWDSRVCALFGYQPRHVEISEKYLVGVPRIYNTVPWPVGHLHTCTLKAIKELAIFYGFDPIYVKGLKGTHPNRLVRSIDGIIAQMPNLATRYIMAVKKRKME
jgi:SAM-dependent methyltransferase